MWRRKLSREGQNSSMTIRDMFDLKGKVAVVTGGAGRFGRQICRALCEAGARVSITYFVPEEIEFSKQLNGEGYDAESFYMDLSSEETIIAYRDHVADKYGRVDILINNAVVRAGGDFDNTAKEQWEYTSRNNSLGTFLVCKYFLEQMVRQQSGSIINIGSIQGCVGPNFTVYGSTGMTSPVFYTYEKWGIVGLTKYIANYYGKYNIRCNCISPGGYYDGQAQEFTDNYCRLTPLGRMAGDEDLKGAIVFFASDAAKYVTGQNLAVDGGWTSW